MLSLCCVKLYCKFEVETDNMITDIVVILAIDCIQLFFCYETVICCVCVAGRTGEEPEALY